MILKEEKKFFQIKYNFMKEKLLRREEIKMQKKMKDRKKHRKSFTEPMNRSKI